MAGITKKKVSEFFVGQGDMFYFDAVTDYAQASLATLANGKSFGNVKEGSTGFTGEDVSTEVIRNEQGTAVVTIPTAGTYSWEFTLLEFDAETLKLLLKGVEIPVGEDTVEWFKSSGAAAIGVGTTLPIVEVPVGFANQTLDKTILAPKGQITSTLTLEDKAWAIKCSVNAQFINTDNLKPLMIVPGAIQYAE
ncbi:MAG: hypothetical protein IKY94_11535 [Lachnospiraceae bacterium]|jgi:hypothetical protein|nr:hypothetical protein [Lachnospiraceae bacterium]